MKKAMEMGTIKWMILFLIMLAIIMILPKAFIMKAGGEAVTSAACTTSLRYHSYSESKLWISPQRTLVDKSKLDAVLDCYTTPMKIKSGTEKMMAGEIVTLMENCHQQFQKYAHIFELEKGSVCISCYIADPAEKKFTSIGELLQKKNDARVKEGKSRIRGFSPNLYTEFSTTGKVTVMAVFAENFLSKFNLENNAGILLWDSSKYSDLPCAVLESDIEKPEKPVQPLKWYS